MTSPSSSEPAQPTFITMGCRLNLAESEAMRALAPADTDMVVINSCAVTNEAVRQTRQAIRKARRERPDARLIVTGCAAQIDPDGFAAMPEVNAVLGNRDKLDPRAFLSPNAIGPDTQIRVSDIMRVDETAPHLTTSFAAHARAFVEVQNGCDHRCTFCIIPYGRGNSRSVPAGAVIETIQRLVDAGHGEVVLTGVDLTSYGHDLPGTPHLGHLVERILKLVPDLKRLRLSSLDGIEVDDRLFDLLTGEARIMPHVHLSLQSGADMILKRMKRRHSRAQAVDLVTRLKTARPEIAVGADLIAGFPTEDAAMHTDNVAIVADCDIVHAHIFPYSPRKGTPAARMPQHDRALIKARAAELRAAATRQRQRWLDGLVSSEQRMLVERDCVSGHSDSFATIALEQPQPAGTIQTVRITGRDKDRLTATPINTKAAA